MERIASDPRELIQHGVSRLNLVLNTHQEDSLIVYLEQLQRWSKVVNLTAIQSVDAIVINHFLDSLAIAPLLDGKSYLDIGTGAGLPGIILAIYFPQKKFILVDSLNKRCRFLHQVCTELNLSNVEIITSRIEALRLENSVVDGIISRAFASLINTVSICQQLIDSLLLSNPCVHFLSMKGLYPQQEMDDLLQQGSITCNIEKCHQLEVPMLNAERHLVHFTIK